MRNTKFHIHVDATVLPPDLETRMRLHGLRVTNFSGHPEGFRHFEPNTHLTWKTCERGVFDCQWEALMLTVSRWGNAFVGYLEGECVVTDEVLAEKPFAGLPCPFKIQRRQLNGSSVEQFRQSELHLVMDKDASNPILIERLLEAGLYGAYIPKPDHTSLVLTAQGYTQVINKLHDAVRRYVTSCGGAVKVTLKKEVAEKYYLQGIEPDKLPEIVDYVEYV